MKVFVVCESFMWGHKHGMIPAGGIVRNGVYVEALAVKKTEQAAKQYIEDLVAKTDWWNMSILNDFDIFPLDLEN